MTMLEIVQQLQEAGNIVRYRVRSDGGILITKINNKNFTGAKGNAFAREIVGASLSEARRSQLESIKPQYDARKGRALNPKERKKFQPDEDIKKYLRKVQRVWRKANISPKQGKITLKKLRYIIQHEGIGKAREALDQALRYATGLAYDKNIDILLGYMNQYYNLIGEEDILRELIEDIDANRHLIKEEYINDIYEILYNVNNGLNFKEAVRQIRNIIGL